MSVSQCPNCGQKISDVTQVCPSCGYQISQDSSDSKASSSKNSGNHKLKKTICICVSAVLCVAIICFSLAFSAPMIYDVLKPSAKSDETTSNANSYDYQYYMNDNSSDNLSEQDAYQPITENNFGSIDYTPYAVNSNSSSYNESSKNSYNSNSTPSTTRKASTTKPSTTKPSTTKHNTTKPVTTNPSTTVPSTSVADGTAKPAITPKEFTLFIEYQTQGIKNHTSAIECLNQYIKTSDSSYISYFYQFVEIAYEAIGQAYEMSLEYDELSPTTNDLKGSYDILYDILTVDHTVLQLGNLIEESINYLDSACKTSRSILNDLQNK